MIVGIYLAAGNSTRMGSNKLALPLGERTLGSTALQAALQSNLDKVILVTKELDQLQWVPISDLYHDKLLHVRCKHAEEGQAESIKCGLKVARLHKASAIVFILADQPFIKTEQLNRMISLAQRDRPSYIACRYENIPQPPVLFHWRLFSRLAQLHGDEGARKIIREDPSGLMIEYENEISFFDADTPSDYEKLKKLVDRK